VMHFQIGDQVALLSQLGIYAGAGNCCFTGHAESDALHTLNFFVNPVGNDFTYTTASGNSYLAPSADPSVPEPSTVWLLGTGVACLARRMRRLMPRVSR